MSFLLLLALLTAGPVEGTQNNMTQVLTAAQAETAWGGGCKPLGLKAVKFDGLLFNWINHNGAIEAFIALGAIFTKHGYDVRAIDTGTYNCRTIKGTNTLSRHAKPTAIDINWKSNPDGSRLVTDIPRAIVDEVLAMRTNSGEQVWRWGGDWDSRPETPHGYYDAMHFELIAHPNDLNTGIATQQSEEDMEFIIGVLKGQNMAFYRAVNNKTGHPFADADIWGSDYAGTKPTDEEWRVHVPAIFGAVMQAGVFFEGSDAADDTARTEALRAHARLDALKGFNF